MSYDVVILGSGPGGYTAAVRAGQYGLKTALVEKRARLGGTCLLVGCVPTKALLHAAELWRSLQEAAADGIHAENFRLDFARIIERKNEIVGQHSRGIEFLMQKNKVEVIRGEGTLEGGGRVAVRNAGGTRILEARAVIVATGSEARLLPGLTPDPERILTNVEILELQRPPHSLVVVGAGAVGVEFASMFHRFGTRVTLLEMLPRILPLEDADVSRELERVFKRSGIRVETGARVERVETTETGVRVTALLAGGQPETFEAEKVLIGVGRRPNTEGIGLENTRVRLERGLIPVDQRQRTAEPGVYAIGDVVLGTPQLAHVAARQGLVAVADIAGKPAEPVNPRQIPSCVYTEPGVASVGLTEEQARAQGYKVRVGKFGFRPNSMATILRRHEGFVKVVSEERYGEILGVHIIGPKAYELIGEAVAAMAAEATVETMMNTIHAHPTLYETLGEAFNAVYGLAINA
ncbi:MAG: dihydrolipoyl dehydrogenase [Bryobacterales bacterium]|nr:dihydrolipoyl dehydrogenase [Bryobacteraceae bacterium]MDW8131086.1 dihydrolipoyl dehydrogenase [Bryobacterales bacterium]